MALIKTSLAMKSVMQSGLFLNASVRAFRKERPPEGASLAEILRFAYSFRSYGISIAPLQVISEISRLLELIRNESVRNLLEIGTANGGTLFLFCETLGPAGKVVSVDYGGAMYTPWKRKLFRQFSRNDEELTLLNADSHDSNTVESVRRLLHGELLDFVFIDGDHSYEGVRSDFDDYSSLLKKGGILGFHDIVEHPANTHCEVNRFWNEVKGSFRHIEIVEDWAQMWGGIGVLYV